MQAGVGQKGEQFPQPVPDTDSADACAIFDSAVDILPDVKKNIEAASKTKLLNMNSNAEIPVPSNIAPNYKMQLQNTVPVVQVKVHVLFLI